MEKIYIHKYHTLNIANTAAVLKSENEQTIIHNLFKPICVVSLLYLLIYNFYSDFFVWDTYIKPYKK